MAYLANKSTVSISIDGQVVNGLKALPDFAENVEQVEVTTLNNEQKRYISGLKDFGELSYTFNFDPAEAKKIKDKENVPVLVTLADGTTVKYTADVSLTISAASSGAAMEMVANTVVLDEVTITLAEAESTEAPVTPSGK